MSAGVLVRRGRWIEPESGNAFAFLTSELTLPPGLIAEIYRQRWNIERLFDETKTKLGKGQAWASSPTAKKAQALFLCMAHKLMVHLEDKLATETGVRNEAEAKRWEQRMEEKIKVAKEASREAPLMLQQPQQPTQRCVKFIRWLRCWFFVEAPWPTAVAALARSFASGCFADTYTCKLEGPGVIVSAKRRRTAGGSHSLGAAQELTVQKMLTDKTPDQLKMLFALWTRRAVCELVAESFGLPLTGRTCGEYLQR